MENKQSEQKLSWHKPEVQKLAVNLDTESTGSLPVPGFLDMASDG